MTRKIFEAVMLAGGDELELRMYGVIGDSWFEDGVTKKMVSDALKAAPNTKAINIRLSSEGGSAFEGLAIRSILAAHPANVTVDVEGIAASAASIIAMAGDKIRMHEGAAMMIHEASSGVFGTIQDHQREIALLCTINDGAAKIYAARSGKPEDEMRALMSAETWLTPSAAVDMGFADEVVAGKSKPPSMALNKFNYRNVPPQLTAAMMAAHELPAKDDEIMATNYARVAAILGLAENAEEAAVMSAVNKLQAMAGELRSITNTADNDALLGAVRAHAEAAKQLPVLKEQIDKQSKDLEAQERAALFAADAADKIGRKLTPATQEFWAKRPVADLREYLQRAPHIVVTQQAASASQPQVATAGAGGNAAGGGDIVKHDGKAWEQMTSAQKHNLFVDSQETYLAVKASWEQRGRPASQQSQQKRVSA